MIISAHDVDLTKLRALTLCIAERASDIGVTKLEKLLYLCDFEAIRTLGKSITADTYKHFEHGPVPKHFKVAFNELQSESKLKSTVKELAPRIKFNEIVPLEKCSQDAFSSEEWTVISRVLAEFGHLPGKVLVRITHEQLPYRITKRNEEIPDFLAHYVDHQQPTQAEVDRLLKSDTYMEDMRARLVAA
jgi:uncharacterized phage-associated protein